MLKNDHVSRKIMESESLDVWFEAELCRVRYNPQLVKRLELFVKRLRKRKINSFFKINMKAKYRIQYEWRIESLLLPGTTVPPSRPPPYATVEYQLFFEDQLGQSA